MTGVTLIVWFDFFFFLTLLSQKGLGYEQTLSEGDGSDKQVVLQNNPFQINLFNLLTDGVCILLAGIKLTFGLRYVWFVSYPPKIAYEYMVNGLGKYKW